MSNKRKTICPICRKITIGTKDKLEEAKCQHCGAFLHDRRKNFIYVPCPSIDCRFENKMPVFGWKKTKCSSCSTDIYHPAFRPFGGHKKGTGLINDTKITIKIPTHDKKFIEQLAQAHESTTSAVLRQMVRYFDNRLS